MRIFLIIFDNKIYIYNSNEGFINFANNKYYSLTNLCENSRGIKVIKDILEDFENIIFIEEKTDNYIENVKKLKETIGVKNTNLDISFNEVLKIFKKLDIYNSRIYNKAKSEIIINKNGDSITYEKSFEINLEDNNIFWTKGKVENIEENVVEVVEKMNENSKNELLNLKNEIKKILEDIYND